MNDLWTLGLVAMALGAMFMVYVYVKGGKTKEAVFPALLGALAAVLAVLRLRRRPKPDENTEPPEPDLEPVVDAAREVIDSEAETERATLEDAVTDPMPKPHKPGLAEISDSRRSERHNKPD